MEAPSTRKTCDFTMKIPSLGKPRDAESYPRDRIFIPHFTTIKDSYYPNLKA